MSKSIAEVAAEFCKEMDDSSIKYFCGYSEYAIHVHLYDYKDKWRTRELMRDVIDKSPYSCSMSIGKKFTIIREMSL